MRFHSISDATCPRHRATDRWPIHGDLFALAEQCRECRAAGKALQGDDPILRLRMLADHSLAIYERQVAAHEASHAVVGFLVGHTLEHIQIANNRGAEGFSEIGGFVRWADTNIILVNHLAMVWAGQEGSLLWLRENGLDTEKNRVDVRHGAWQDAREADEYTSKAGAAPTLGRRLSAALVQQHWAEIRMVADVLVERQELDGAELYDILRQSLPAGRPDMVPSVLGWDEDEVWL